MAGAAGGLRPLAVSVCPIRQWRDDGTLETVFHALSENADMENLSIDSTCVKVHGSANGGGKNGG